MFEPEILCVDDVTAAARRLFEERMRDSVEARGRFTVALSGGSTPLPLYRQLASRPSLPWERTWVAWGDERYVPPDHPDSNAGAARRTLLGEVPIPESQVLAWPYLESPEASAEAYAAALQGALGDEPSFDLTLLGLGADGHTASLFPGTGAALRPGVTLVVRPPGQRHPRLSLAAETLSRSRVVAFLVQGEAKRAALEATLSSREDDPDRFPAHAIRARERLLIVTDVDDLRGTPAAR